MKPLKIFFQKETLLSVTVLLTGVYLVLLLLTTRGLPGDAITAFIGLFVPFGIWNGIVSLLKFFGISIIIFITLIIYLDKFFERGGMPFEVKICLSLIFLFAATAIVDFSLWHSWFSMQFFLKYSGIDPSINLPDLSKIE